MAVTSLVPNQPKGRQVLTPRLTRFGVVALLTPLIAAGFAQVRRATEGDAWRSGWSAALGAIILLLLLRAASRLVPRTLTNSPWRSSLVVGMCYLIFGVVLPGVFVGATGSGIEDTLLLPDLRHPAAAIWLLCTGFAVALVAYCLVNFIQLKPHLSLNRRQVHAGGSLVVFVFGLVLSLATILARGRSIDGRSPLPGLLVPFEQLIASGPTFMLLAIAGLASTALRSNQRLACVMVATASLVGLADGFFKPSVWALMAYLLGRNLSDHRCLTRPRATRLRSAFRISAAALAIVAIIPIVEATRHTDVHSGEKATIASAYDQTWGSDVSSSWEVVKLKALGRQASVLAGAQRIVDRVPRQVAARGLEPLVLLPVLVVPRFLWPSKPSLSPGVDASVQIFDQQSNTLSSSSVSTFGDAYWFSGLLGLVIGSAAIGSIMGFIDSSLRVNAAAVCRLSLLPLLVDLDNGLAQWVLGAIEVSVVVYFASTLSSSRRR